MQVVCYFKYTPEGASRMTGAPVELDKKLGGLIASLRERGEFVGDRQLFGLQARDLLKDGDGLERKPLLAVMIGDADKALDGLAPFFEARVEVAERVERGVIVRLSIDDAAIFLHGGADLALRKIFLSRVNSLSLVECHED